MRLMNTETLRRIWNKSISKAIEMVDEFRVMRLEEGGVK